MPYCWHFRMIQSEYSSQPDRQSEDTAFKHKCFSFINFILKIKHWKGFTVLKSEIVSYTQSLQVVTLKLVKYILCDILIDELCSVFQIGKCVESWCQKVCHRLLSLHHQDLPGCCCQSWSTLFYLFAILVWCLLLVLGRTQRQVALQLPSLATVMCQVSHFHLNSFIWRWKPEPKRTQTAIPLTELSHACHSGRVQRDFWQGCTS